MSKTISRAMLFALLALFIAEAQSAKQVQRPKILGIASVHFVSSDIPHANKLYRDILGDDRICNWCEEVPTSSGFVLPTGQTVTLSAVPSTAPTSFLVDITFLVDDTAQLKKYLASKHIPFKELPASSRRVAAVSVVDPEGHTLHFITQSPLHPISFVGHPQIIHAGIIVKDRAATDHFYKDILGFHLYWQGGFKEGTTNWVAMQVPDGTNWIEYMLNEDTSTQAERGVMNHVSIGVPSIKVAAASLENAGVNLTSNEQPKMGLDGKWQLNLYDPDLSRVELMEFTPTGKTCCNEFTGPHPKP
jgi:catechol 2,3-dioxygenase-like lactoylglutathione lyase family enzyme